MKALSRSRTTRKPLIAPIRAPVANSTRIASQTFSPKPEPPKVVSLTISQAASIGGKPTVDSSERSNLPAIRISDSAMTRTDSSDDCCRMLRKLLVVRKASLISAPATIASAIAGRSVSSRKRNADARRRISAPMPVGVATRSRASVATFHSLDRRDQVVIPPAGAELGHQPAPEDHQHPVAADQLVEIVGHDQHARAGGARLL